MHRPLRLLAGASRRTSIGLLCRKLLRTCAHATVLGARRLHSSNTRTSAPLVDPLLHVAAPLPPHALSSGAVPLVYRRTRIDGVAATPHRVARGEQLLPVDASCEVVPIVLLHCLLGDGAQFQLLEVQLHQLLAAEHAAAAAARIPAAASHRLVLDLWLPDARNHGASPHTDRHDYDALVADLRAFIRSHGLHRPLLGGHSMGGKTAVVYTLSLSKDEHAASAASVPRGLIGLNVTPFADTHQLTTIFDSMQYLSDARTVDGSPLLRTLHSKREADRHLRALLPSFIHRTFVLTNLVEVDALNAMRALQRGGANTTAAGPVITGEKIASAGFAWRVNVATLDRWKHTIQGWPLPPRCAIEPSLPALLIACSEALSDFLRTCEQCLVFPTAPPFVHRSHAKECAMAMLHFVRSKSLARVAPPEPSGSSWFARAEAWLKAHTFLVRLVKGVFGGIAVYVAFCYRERIQLCQETEESRKRLRVLLQLDKFPPIHKDYEPIINSLVYSSLISHRPKQNASMSVPALDVEAFLHYWQRAAATKHTSASNDEIPAYWQNTALLLVMPAHHHDPRAGANSHPALFVQSVVRDFSEAMTSSWLLQAPLRPLTVLLLRTCMGNVMERLTAPTRFKADVPPGMHICSKSGEPSVARSDHAEIAQLQSKGWRCEPVSETEHVFLAYIWRDSSWWNQYPSMRALLAEYAVFLRVGADHPVRAWFWPGERLFRFTFPRAWCQVRNMLVSSRSTRDSAMAWDLDQFESKDVLIKDAGQANSLWNRRFIHTQLPCATTPTFLIRRAEEKAFIQEPYDGNGIPHTFQPDYWFEGRDKANERSRNWAANRIDAPAITSQVTKTV